MLAEVHALTEPSAWVVRWSTLIPTGGWVLDLACGAGRHARWLADRGHRVAAVDRDLSGWAQSRVGIESLEADLESGPDGGAAEWPYPGRTFAGIVVTNYLHRPLLPTLVMALDPDGVLIYETFAAGNERYGKPASPAFLLQPGELLETVRGKLRVVAYEDLYVDQPRPAMVQRICARRS